jgi:hypothetical protein
VPVHEVYQVNQGRYQANGRNERKVREPWRCASAAERRQGPSRVLAFPAWPAWPAWTRNITPGSVFLKRWDMFMDREMSKFG